MAVDPEIDAALAKGMELFNRGEFYEAHEIWEDAWTDAQMDDRHLLQGLIQVAAGFFKLQTGMPTGTLKLLEKAEGHLRAVPPDCHGLNLETLLAAVVSWRATAKRMVEEWRTDFDAALLPRLEKRA
jgi:uncharacterized protein